MADERCTVGYNSSPRKKFRLLDELGDPVDLTGFTVKMMVKPFLSNEDGKVPDSRALFDVTGTVDADQDENTGEYYFDFTPAETCSPPGTCPGETRFWSGATTVPPKYRRTVDFVVSEPVDLA